MVIINRHTHKCICTNMHNINIHSYNYTVQICGPNGLFSNKWPNGMLLLIEFNVGFTEVVPTVGGEREEGDYISNLYTVTTRMISALR